MNARLADLKHAHHEFTVSAIYTHLDHDPCLETVILKGPTAEVLALADEICAGRGAHHGKLNLISVDIQTPNRHRKSAANTRCRFQFMLSLSLPLLMLSPSFS